MVLKLRLLLAVGAHGVAKIVSNLRGLKKSLHGKLLKRQLRLLKEWRYSVFSAFLSGA